VVHRQAFPKSRSLLNCIPVVTRLRPLQRCFMTKMITFKFTAYSPVPILSMS
jgi:hypothetical protein